MTGISVVRVVLALLLPRPLGAPAGQRSLPLPPPGLAAVPLVI